MALSKLAKLYAKHPEFYRLHLQKYNQAIAPFLLISAEPLIIYTPSTLVELLYASLEPIYNHLQDESAYFLKSWYWDMETPSDVEELKNLENIHINKYPKHQFIHLCNTLPQQEIFLKYKLKALFCNQNCLIDDSIFRPISSIAKVFDAIYDAKLTAFKRHYLAQKIDSIAFIYYYNPLVDSATYQEVKSLFPQAHYFNENLAEKGYVLLSPERVNECLNLCRVGLCLSSVEGAMYASIQYLLSGLPVVSTQSKGGRDVFFDPEYTLIVDDDPDVVKEGVDEMIRRNIPPETIRSKVLDKIREHRLVLIQLVQSIYDRENVDRDFSQEWEQIFTNKLIKLQSPQEVIKQLELARPSHAP